MRDPAARRWVGLAALVMGVGCNSGPSAEECSTIQRELIAAVSASNSCTRHEDCALVTSNVTCKGLGYNKAVDPKAFEPKVAAFEKCLATNGLTCKLDFATSSAPCQNGRCVDNVDAYSIAADAGVDGAR